MTTLRDRIAAIEDRASTVVDVPEWGCTLLLREMTGAQRDELANIWIEAQDGTRQRIPPGLRERQIIAAAHDPDTGEPVFTLDDIEMLSSKSLDVLDRLAGEIDALSGTGAGAVDDALGKSEIDPSLATGTG